MKVRQALCDATRVRGVAMLVCLGACTLRPPTLAIDGGESVPDGADAHASPVVRAIDLQPGQVTGGPHTDFPMLISLSEPWLRDVAHGGDVALPDGLDVYFTADRSTMLMHEVESYDAVAGTLAAWVRIPALTSATTFYLHYGDAGTQSSGSSTGVWSGYELVLHMDATLEDAAAMSTSFTDRTSGVVAARFGGGRVFDGVDDAIIAGSAAAIDDVFVSGGTADAWFYADSYGEMMFGRLFDKGHVAGWSLALNNMTASGSFSFVHGTESATFGEWLGPGQAVSLGAWHHAAVVYNSSTPAMAPVVYIDGIPQTISVFTTPGATADSDAAVDLYIGNRAAGDRTFDGVLDEMRISSQARTAGWLATQYRNQSNPSSFYVVHDPSM